jgi:hypothetical protein
MPESFFGPAQLQGDVLDVETTNVLEFDALEEIPDVFLRVEFWGIRRQAFQMDAFGSAFCQESFDRLRAMNGGPIPNDEQVARDLALEQLQEAHDIGSLVGMVSDLHAEPSFRSDASNGREVIVGQFHRQDRCLAYRRIRAHRHGHQVKRGLIYKDNRTRFVFGLFFNASQRSSFQALMAASSRWVAFWMGFCRLYLRRRSRRLQWAG